MARIRTIKPEFWTSEQIMDCEMATRLLFIGMWNFADDYGRMPYAPRTIKAQVFPGDNIAASEIDDRLKELNSKGLILIYSVDDKEYLEITGWKHQKIDKPTSKHPAPFAEESASPRRAVTEPSPPEGKGRDKEEEKDSEANASGADAPRDYRAELFGRGLTKLASLTGKGPDACRSFVGKCLKAAGDDAVTVLGLIEDAERNRVADPSSWIAARLKATGPPSAKPLTEFQRKQAETNDVRAHLRNLGSGGGRGGSSAGILPDDHGERPEAIRDGTGSTVRLLPGRIG